SDRLLPAARWRARACANRDWSAAAPVAGVKNVAQAVAQEVEAQYGDHDGEAGEDAHPGSLSQEGSPLRQHPAPTGIGRLRTETEEGQRGLGQDGERQAQ